MIRSMTGFGKSQADLPDKITTIEIRSLNSKQLDLNFRLPTAYREKEMAVRSMAAQKMERGKIDVTVSIEAKYDQPVMSVNKAVAMQYLEQLKGLSVELPENQNIDYLSILVRMPDVLKSDKEELSAEEWEKIRIAFDQALAETDRFRLAEGLIIEHDFIARIDRILALLNEIEPLENARIAAIRAKFESRLQELRLDKSYDQNRLEQELVYYFEKLDITEEKTRLSKHCDYFLLAMNDAESPGKKLGFIAQEIGREINTLGSKANDAAIQMIVVQMKDELEKVKEQLANVL